MATDFMAVQWGAVDRASDPRAFIRYLDTVSELETIRRIKQQTYDLLQIREGDQLLDVGCGTGDDVRDLARRVGATGRVVGVDGSESMLAEARIRARNAKLPVEFIAGNAERLEFEDNEFDGCRAERLFVHLMQPDQGLAEMVRVARPGARIVVFDVDWETLIVDSPDRAITRKLLNFHCDSGGNRWVGRQLWRLYSQAGLKNVRVFAETLVFTHYEMANRVFTLEEIAAHAAASGAVSSEQASQWLSGLRKSDELGSFFAAATGFCVSGEKPRPVSAVITLERPDSADASELISELEAHLETLYPRESRHGYSVEKLIAEGVAFFVLREDGIPAGCGGIQLFGTEYGEVKRMYVRPQFRGLGFGKLILDQLADYARTRGVGMLRLETGIHQPEAIRLYERFGFQRVPAFGSYIEDPLCLYYEKRMHATSCSSSSTGNDLNLP